MYIYHDQIEEKGLWSKFEEKEYKKTKYNGRTPLRIAADMDNISIIKLLLEKKDIDINLEDLNGKKPVEISYLKKTVDG